MISRRCKCGCGGITKQGNKYIHGHNRRGIKLSEKTKYNMSLAHVGNSHSEETKKKISLILMGKKPSDESKLKMSISHMKCRTDGYCDAWYDKEYKNDLRKDVCSDCGMTTEESLQKWGSKLSLHHKDGNKENCYPNNIDTLCISCHAFADWELRKQKESHPYKQRIKFVNSGV